MSRRAAHMPHHTFGADLRGLALTGVFCVAIATVLWLVDVRPRFVSTLMISLCIGYSINIAHFLSPLLSRVLASWIAAIVLTGVGLAIGLLIAGAAVMSDPLFFFDRNYSTLVIGVFFGVVGYAVFGTRARLLETRAELRAVEAQRLAQEKQVTETRLQLLQAQIEPHFLFNTLSNVVGLIDPRPHDAKQTLLHLTTMLRATLDRTRHATTTLGEELDVVGAYLQIQKIRMGERLDFSIRCADSLREVPLPPLLLQPLVENAVKHGIDPTESGGRIDIDVSDDDRALRIEIRDTGQGMAADGSAAAGTGITNVQQRLHGLFGERAGLALLESDPGVVIRLRIPVTAA